MVMPVTVEDLAGWDADLRALTDGLGWPFQRPEPRRVFADFVRTLLADVPKKNSWGLAEHAGYATPRPVEQTLPRRPRQGRQRNPHPTVDVLLDQQRELELRLY